MKTLINIFLVVIVGSLLFATSCFKAEDPLYNTAATGGTSFLQFSAINSTTAMTPADADAFAIPFGIKILGAPAASDMTVKLTLLTGTTVTTSQVSLSSTSVLIKAGTVQGNIFLNVDPNAFDLSPDTLRLKLGIDPASGTPAEFGGTSTFNFVYNVCPYDILDFLGGFICNEEGYGEYNVSFTLDPEVENRIHNSNFWDWAGPGETVYYDFSGDENQIITIPDQPFIYGDGTVGSVDGTGTYDACTGKFSCDYTAWYGGDGYATHHDFYRGGKKASKMVWVKKPAFLENN